MWLSVEPRKALGSELGKEKQNNRIFAMKGRVTEPWVGIARVVLLKLGRAGRQAGRAPEKERRDQWRPSFCIGRAFDFLSSGLFLRAFPLGHDEITVGVTRCPSRISGSGSLDNQGPHAEVGQVIICRAGYLLALTHLFWVVFHNNSAGSQQCCTVREQLNF